LIRMPSSGVSIAHFSQLPVRSRPRMVRFSAADSGIQLKSKCVQERLDFWCIRFRHSSYRGTAAKTERNVSDVSEFPEFPSAQRRELGRASGETRDGVEGPVLRACGFIEPNRRVNKQDLTLGSCHTESVVQNTPLGRSVSLSARNCES
jgi:hypothetical protein